MHRLERREEGGEAHRPEARHDAESHGRPVIEVPFDPHLRPGGVIDVAREMAPATRRKFLEITATIAGYFAARPHRPGERGPKDQ